MARSSVSDELSLIESQPQPEMKEESPPEAVDTGVKKLKDRLTMKCQNDMLREAVAEFLGTFILTLVGDSVMAVTTLTDIGGSTSVIGPIGWGLALMLAINVSGGVSGGHLNPAVTLAMASVGKLPWKKVLAYFFSQYIGAFMAAVILYGIYYESIINFDAGHHEVPPNASATAQIFATYPAAHAGSITTFFDQVVSTMLFMMAIVAITDPNNMMVPKGSYALFIGLSLSTIIFAFPLNCGAPLNPARDLSPRIFTAIAGWGSEVFSYRNYGYFWVPVLGPHVGAIVGVWLYRLLVEQHWPVDSYDFGSPAGHKANGEFKKTDDLAFVDKKRSTSVEIRND